jgi:YidC/Oxa1 family membrane protein insertase
MSFWDYIIWPFAFLLRLFYNMSGGSYLFALLMFTIIIRLVMLPSSLKSQTTQAGNMFLTIKQNKIREKYKDDKQKQSEEIQRLYESEGINPMSGCLPMLLPLIILWPVFRIIYQPITYIANINPATIKKATELLTTLGTKVTKGREEFDIISNLDLLKDKMPEFVNKVSHLNLKAFGVLDLTAKPSIKAFGWLWLIPIIAAVTSWIFGKVTTNMTKQATGQTMNMAGMNLLMPLMSLWMCFTFPAGLGIYWIFSNIIGLVVQLLINKFYNPQIINAKAEKKRRDARIAKEKAIKDSIN